MNEKVEENIPQKRFELKISDDALAAAYYRLDGVRVVLIHTEVPAEFSGQGIATELAHGTFSLLRETGRTAVPKCPFMSRFVARHPEYADLVAG
jgi:predicted GNAT family acetyltransferase